MVISIPKGKFILRTCQPEAGESEDEFISRCIGIFVNKGKDQSQAAAICHSIWNEQDSFATYDNRQLSDEDKSSINADLKSMPMKDVVAFHRRLHQWAAQGNLLSGFTKADMNWCHTAVEDELARRAKEDDREPSEPSPLEWGRSGGNLPGTPEYDQEGDEDFIERHVPSAVKKIIAKAKSKKKKSSYTQIERRYTISGELRLSSKEDGNEEKIFGYAAIFNVWSEDLGFFKEQIAPGAFSKTIKDGDIRALVNHDPNLIIGRTKNKTLGLWEDEKGLGFEVILPDTSYAKDLKESIKRKDITQNSFGFAAVQDEWSKDGRRRTLREVKLFDISPVTFPAYKQTSVMMRLHDMGIDYEALNIALIRMDRGIQMDSDVDLVKSTIEILRQYIPDLAVEPLIAGVDAPEHSATEEEPELISTLIRVRLANMCIRKQLARR